MVNLFICKENSVYSRFIFDSPCSCEVIKYWQDNNFKLHRLNGPAAIMIDKCKLWYYHGKSFNCKNHEEFKRLLKLSLLW